MRIIAVEGHDGSGKTSVATMLAEKLNAKYVKPYDGLLGDHIAWCWKTGRFGLANEISMSAVEKEIAHRGNHSTLVFDRHWLTMFTVLPEEYWSSWGRLPITVLCWTNEESTVQRLHERGEIDEAKSSVHKYYCVKYREIANRYGAFVVDTTMRSVGESVENIVSYLDQHHVFI